MHVGGFALDLNWFFQFIFTAFVVAFGLLHLVKNTASKYFVVDANFDSSLDSPLSLSSLDPADRKNYSMPGVIGPGDACAVCGDTTKKHCSRCKRVKYCSEACQSSHWKSGHKTKCKDFRLSGKSNSVQSASALRERRASTEVSLVSASGTSKILNQTKKVLFPYEEFVELFNWDKPGFLPCGLLNCGNSCFANVVLQCLSYTRPLVAYLLEKGHRRECRRNDWCFLCEFEIHVERASRSLHPFSPINILSRLPNIGGNLGYGKQEDAHEFMRFVIDTMQSVCLDEFGGEKAVHPSSQETTLIQHIFGGHLQSQVTCSKCSNISNQFENMMDLTVEIQGDAASLEECLDQFTVKEYLDGDNKYKCDGCNDYVLAWKRLTVRRAPNILTIALKRFQSGRFGKLNKRVTFPETLDLSPYMSEAGDGGNVYKLYAVVVHLDMLNASYFGHYICYTKDFHGNWYRIDDCKVASIELDEVLSQGAYMLLYSRISARPSFLNPIESVKEQEIVQVAQKVEPCTEKPVECFSATYIGNSGSLPSASSSHAMSSSCEEEMSSITNSEGVKEDLDMEDVDMVDYEASSSVSRNFEVYGNGCSNSGEGIPSPVEHSHQLVSGAASLADRYSTEGCVLNHEPLSPICSVENGSRADRCCAKECALMNSLTKGSVATKNHAFGKGEMSCDVSVASLSSNEVLDRMDFVNSRAKLEKAEPVKSLPFVSGVEDVAGKLNGRYSSGPKLKPMFSPGFLGKRPRNKLIKQDGKAAPIEFGESVSALNLKKQNNGFAKPDLSNQNACQMLEGKPSIEYNNLSSPTFMEKETRKSGDEDQMITSESGQFIRLCNGDADVPIISNESLSNVIKDHRALVVKQNLTHDE